MKIKVQVGWSLPFIPIILIIIGICIYYFGWSVILWVIAIVLGITLCVYIYDQVTGSATEDEQPFDIQNNIDSAIKSINDFEGEPADFGLCIPDALQDPVGANIAIIMDAALNRGWEPRGYDQFEGYRVYYYKNLE